MPKIVINRCYGGFTLSQAALARLLANGFPVRSDHPAAEGRLWLPDGDGAIARHDPRLVAVVVDMGEAAWGACAELEIVDAGPVYRITERDGVESVEEPGTGWVVAAPTP